MTSCAMMCTVADRAAANALADALGYGPDNFSVALSATGQTPATHFGGFAASDVGMPFQEMVAAAAQGQMSNVTLPEPHSALDIAALFSRLVFEFDLNWQETLAAHGLEVVSVDEGI